MVIVTNGSKTEWNRDGRFTIQSPSAHGVKNTSLVRHYPQAFPRLYFAQPQLGSEIAPNWTGQLSNVSLQTLPKIHHPIQWAGILRRYITRQLSPEETGPFKGPQQTLLAPHRLPTRGSSNPTSPLNEGTLSPTAWPQGVWFYKSKDTVLYSHSFDHNLCVGCIATLQ